MKDQILITICGRAGSKGFKNKNLKKLLGVPLCYYTLTCAQHLVNHAENADIDICINTDSEDLIVLAQRSGCNLTIIRRPEELCGDAVGKFDVFKHCLKTMEDRNNKKYDYLLDLDITSPLRSLEDALNALNCLRLRPDAEMTITGCPSRRNPYFNMVEQRGDYVEKVIDRPLTARQQAPKVYDMNASIYVLRTDFVRAEEHKYILEAKSIIYEMEDTGFLDIDSEEDFVFMQIIALYLFEKQNYKPMYLEAKKMTDMAMV